MFIGLQALAYCYCLRNVAFPPDAVFGDEDGEGSVIEGSDLQRSSAAVWFGSRNYKRAKASI